MLEKVISTLAAWIVAVISAGGYFGVVALMAIESACIPLPSEIIMPFAGYLASIGQLSLIGAATAGALGSHGAQEKLVWQGFRGRFGGAEGGKLSLIATALRR
jgi:membrane protein DedA with SNARE-associated domain